MKGHGLELSWEKGRGLKKCTQEEGTVDGKGKGQNSQEPVLFGKEFD